MSWISAATASSSRSDQPTAGRSPPPRAGGQGVDAEALWLHLPTAVGLKEVRSSARCRLIASRPDGLRTSTGRAPRPPRRPPSRAVGEAQGRDRQPTSPSTASINSPTRAISAVAARITRSRDSIRTGKRSTASKASAKRLPGPGRALRRVLDRDIMRVDFSVAVVVVNAIRDAHRQRRTFGLAFHRENGALARIPAPRRWSAESIRANDSDLPSAASDSKIPGETVVPVIATRIGW